ncbi:MAG: DUF4856 domain-containing protein [Flavobacteriales bacterium]|nr:DUF4856 domain-containing protein [Flavobacteriales bacterium]MCW8913687.1 DUF4856 domain-containing protein [Flavobacteriales bacterium]MCW8937859.1 DUF4856 domain-containing protein [Flavobacteriales bacterium]MCW8940832.1 DUF4856 domain-containing protein [Flavobacteriales bacterium]MCW8967291.1 DUF4856 domain-containing protein [Flavobacteriales bacterium]
MNRIGILVLSALLMFSCSKDDDAPTPVANNGGGGGNPTYQIPTTYVFVDGSSQSTVNFDGQKQRLEMLSEMVIYMKTANTLGTTVSATQLKNMYANNGYTWTDAPGLGMTGSTKQLKNKTAEGDIGIQAMFENYMDSLAYISSLNFSNSTETYGQAGVWTNGTKSYLMGGNGFEYGQLIEKGLMTAVFMNQMTVNYLGTLADDDNTTPLPGKTYTEMQHHWDEAFGYFSSETDYPTNGADRFWGKYAQGSLEALLGTGTNIMNAFLKGRAAIDNNDYATRDAQIAIIRDQMEKVCAGTAIHYLNEAKANITSPIVKNHVLSEAIAFIDGLRYGYNSINGVSITSAEVDIALGYIGNDLSAVSITNLNLAIDLIASKTGLNDVKASL